MKIIDMAQAAKDNDIYIFDTDKLARVTPEIKELVELNFPKTHYGDDILIYEAWSLRSILEVAMLIAVERSKK